jgi:hypothetical protein
MMESVSVIPKRQHGREHRLHLERAVRCEYSRVTEPSFVIEMGRILVNKS